VGVLLEVHNLRTQFATARGVVRAVDGVSFRLNRGEVVALVGESGSGKTVLAHSILGLVPPPGRVVSGRIVFQGRDLLGLNEEEMRHVRGGDLAITLQDPMTALSPLTRIGVQIKETMSAHRPRSRGCGPGEVVSLMRRVQFPAPERRARQYPHQLSGGMRQRAMIAMGVANQPDLLIADEATTALDVTTQAQIVALLEELQSELGSAILLVTHNMGLVARLCQRMIVLYGGRIVEEGPVEDLFADPRHPYTWGLLRSVPRVDDAASAPRSAIPGTPPDPAHLPPGCTFEPRCPFRVPRCREEEPGLVAGGGGRRLRCWVPMEAPTPKLVNAAAGLASVAEAEAESSSGTAPRARGRGGETVLEAVEVVKVFGAPSSAGGTVSALSGVSFALRRGETLGLIGESGCGKTTLACIVSGLLEPTSGQMLFEGEDISGLDRQRRRRFRREVQIIFQNPFSSLDPRMTVGASVAEPLENFPVGPAAERRARVAQLLAMVGLDERCADRYPHEFSGGQRQRIGIARALALDPSVIVCDEAVSALDVSTQTQIVDLLGDLQARLGVAYLFISHDLAVVRSIATRVAVMYLGALVETAPAEAVFKCPQHPYTKALLDASPLPDPAAERARGRFALVGEPTSDIPPGCRFHPRCPLARRPGACEDDEPLLTARRGGPEHLAACHFPLAESP
jgi:peptide/nickel transport system ATP-binding protein